MCDGPDAWFVTPNAMVFGAALARGFMDARAHAPLHAFVRAYAAARGDAAGGGALADGWESPQTSVMLVDVRWARETLGAFWRAVDETGCVYDNRWGDLPLWGAALALHGERAAILPLSYEHGSHLQLVLPGYDSADS